MIVSILLLGCASLLISWLLTAAMIRVAPRIGFVDKPGHRKIHDNPKPLGGGVGILLGVLLPMWGILIYAYLNVPYAESHRMELKGALLGGVYLKQRLAAGIVLAMIA